MQNPVLSKDQKLCMYISSVVSVTEVYLFSLAALVDILKERKASELTMNLFGKCYKYQQIPWTPWTLRMKDTFIYL